MLGKFYWINKPGSEPYTVLASHRDVVEEYIDWLNRNRPAEPATIGNVVDEESSDDDYSRAAEECSLDLIESGIDELGCVGGWQVAAWVDEMIAAGRADDEAHCAQLLGLTDLRHLRDNGADHHLALAFAALLAGQRPYRTKRQPTADA